jgi:hypothetical protein
MANVAGEAGGAKSALREIFLSSFIEFFVRRNMKKANAQMTL